MRVNWFMGARDRLDVPGSRARQDATVSPIAGSFQCAFARLRIAPGPLAEAVQPGHVAVSGATHLPPAARAGYCPPSTNRTFTPLNTTGSPQISKTSTVRVARSAL